MNQNYSTNSPHNGYSSAQFNTAPAGGAVAPMGNGQQRTPKQIRAMGLSYAAGYLIAIWSVFIINSLLFGGTLNRFGIQPLDTSSLLHIFTAPFLHADLGHIISNSLPGAIFCFIIGYSGSRVFWEVTVISVVIAGAGTWLLGGVGTNHIGASGVVYGWLAYLIVRGFFNHSGRQITVGIILGFLYSGLIWGILPGNPGVSWQGHLFGAIGGVAAGMFITSDDPPALKARRERQAVERGRGRV